MPMRMRAGAVTFAGAALLLAAFRSGLAAAEFYRDRTVTILVASPPGGGFDLYARLLGQYMPASIPGKPNVVYQYMPGAGGVKAANYFYNVAPRDGSYIAVLLQTAALFQALHGAGVKYDASKFRFIGRMGTLNTALMVWHTAPARTIAQAKKTEIIFCATGKASQSYFNPILLRKLVGAKVKVITGYSGASDINIALERGEIQAYSSAWTSWKAAKHDWLVQKKIIPLTVVALEREPDLPDVPVMSELAGNPDDKAVLEFVASYAGVGTSAVTTQQVPADRVEALRQAFDATMKDPAFLVDAKKRRIEIAPLSGAKVQNIVDRTVGAPAALRDRAKKLLEW
jgi:tripartite-type tricarboxylate transporter receptor subunit TctC